MTSSFPFDVIVSCLYVSAVKSDLSLEMSKLKPMQCLTGANQRSHECEGKQAKKGSKHHTYVGESGEIFSEGLLS
jgi:hypothetical protein